MSLWEVDILPAAGQPDVAARQLVEDARDLGVELEPQPRAARGFLLQGEVDEADVRRAAHDLLTDPVTETARLAPVGDAALSQSVNGLTQLVHVLYRPGVMDPVALSTRDALQDMGVAVDEVATIRKYWFGELPAERLQWLCAKLLYNESIEQVVIGPLTLDRIDAGQPYRFELVRVPIRQLDDAGLMRLSHEGQLYLSLEEMRTIQSHFRSLGRDPTDIELETLAQTWSEHCSHKTLTGRIEYRDENGTRHFENMLKETIFAATQQIREQLGANDWCVKVFSDNAGIVKFDEQYHVVFKVETHNHPSAIEPYGGANTGIGGVIRDTLGTGLAARPICNTDVFCFAPPEGSVDELPPGVLHPRRIIKGVVAGVRDYGNRMGIPTVNGAVYFDRRYLGNPLVYCGNVGLLPVDRVHKAPRAGDWIVTLGGRTGRDGIHGATFSSAELTSESESISGGAVQIGNPITEKMVLDVLLRARDLGLYNAVTDCGAGGFSSAVGEMGASIGAEVWLERAPLKYVGLSYTEIWISEAQERMVLAVPPDKLQRLMDLCAAEGVEAAVIGQFVPTGQLRLMYEGHEVGLLSMEFLHDGRPPVTRQAHYDPPAVCSTPCPELNSSETERALLDLLGSLNIASKHWIIRQYDHEVQGGSAVKPLVGPLEVGPSDAAVVRPRLESYRGVVISCGMNPKLGDYDPYHMAATAIDEALRNAVAVGADPSRIALLDNFCWGNTERAETLGSLVRAAQACHDVAVAWQTPFISGKDSLNNEFAWTDQNGEKRTLAIPPSLLISAIGQVNDVRQCVTMDLKRPGNPLYLVGVTGEHFGGSHFFEQQGLNGGVVPQVDVSLGKRVFPAVHQAILQGMVKACHDVSEGGLAVALAEMAFSGNLGAAVQLEQACAASRLHPTALLFSESNTRFVVEVAAQRVDEFEELFGDVPHVRIGEVTDGKNLRVEHAGATVIELPLETLLDAWRRPLDWN